MARSNDSTSPGDLALTVWLEELATGRRVLWVGDAATGATDRIATFAHDLRVLDTSGRGRSRRASGHISAYRGLDDLELDADFDLVVVPDAGVFEDLEAAAEALRGTVGDGVLVFGADAGEEPDDVYSGLLDALEPAYREVRMLAVGAFHGAGIIDLESEGGEVVVDGSLLGEETEPIRRFLALAADEVPAVDPHVLVQVRREPAPRAEATKAAEAHAVEVRALRDELERSTSRLEQAQARLVSTEAELAEARSALREADAAAEARSAAEATEATEAPAGDTGADVERLETRLRERGARVRELEAEVERRAVLVRDLAEELREQQRHGEAPTGSADAVARTLDAEAARDEARFQVDELEARLASRERTLAALQKDLSALEGDHARFEGRARGFRSRIAELEELAEIGAARIRLLELDVDGGAERARSLEGRLAEAREELELALIQARGPRPSEARVGELERELDEANEALADAVDERDRARAENLRLTAQLGMAETRMEGLRLGYEMRIAMIGSDAVPLISPEGLDALHSELGELRGARDGLRLRLRDLEASLRELAAAPPKGADEADALRADVDVLRAETSELTLRAADLETARAAAEQRAADLTSALAARDALVTRLQMDLAEEEHAARLHDQQMNRLAEENERLRDGVLAASDAVAAQEAAEHQVHLLREALAAAEARAAIADEETLKEMRAEADEAARALIEARSEAADARAHVEALEKRQSADATERAREHAEEVRRLQDQLAAHRAEAERVGQLEAAMTESQARGAKQAGLLNDAMQALRETRRVLDGLRAERDGDRPAPSEITAMGMDAPEAAEAKLQRELDDKETLLRSLTAQLEERDDRLRAMERRLAEGPGSEVDAGELMELEERVARLQEELRHERDARSAAEQELDRVVERPNAEEEVERVRAQLQTRDAALDVARSRARAAAKDVESLREVCADTRHGLEELLGAATSAGDPATAERIGALLSVLSRY